MSSEVSAGCRLAGGGAGPVRVGQQGLKYLGVTQNMTPIELPGGGYRIPDILDKAAGVVGFLPQRGRRRLLNHTAFCNGVTDAFPHRSFGGASREVGVLQEP